MGKPKNVVLTTVSVPRELKARMKAAGGAVNWSAVATRAFEAKLLELESQREAGSMDEVFARLDAAEELEAKEDYQAGLNAGREWARGPGASQRGKTLRRIAEYIEQDDIGWWDHDANWLAPFGALDYFVFAAWPDRNDDHAAADEFFQEALGNDAHRVFDADFFHGFGDGVVEVWDAYQAYKARRRS
jgi:hypothetical protein